MRAGPLKVRVTTNPRSDFRSAVVRFFMGMGSGSLLASIDLLPPFQFLDNLVQLVEACVPELAKSQDNRVGLLRLHDRSHSQLRPEQAISPQVL
jgi:hypothetical protein